jgi:hypothetical protein
LACEVKRYLEADTGVCTCGYYRLICHALVIASVSVARAGSRQQVLK